MLRPYYPGDVWLIVNDLSQQEIDECKAVGITPIENIQFGVEHGKTFTLELGGEVAGVVGVIRGNGYDIPWSAFNSVVCKHPVEFLRLCKRWVSEQKEPLRNVVDARHTRAIRWLEWLGFTVGPAEPLGVNGELLHQYWRTP